MSLATLNISPENLLSEEAEPPRIVFIEVSCFSTCIVVVTRSLNAFVTVVKTPTDAPKAKTRAFAASIDFVNSSALPVILPKG